MVPDKQLAHDGHEARYTESLKVLDAHNSRVRKAISRAAFACLLAAAGISTANAAVVKLGMATEEAKAVLIEPKEIPVSGIPNYTTMFSERLRLTIGLCRGRVTWIAEDGGKSLSDFVFHVKETETVLGAPHYGVYQARSGQGELTYVTATWPTMLGSFSIRHGFTYWAGEDVAMITSAYADSDAAFRCK